eukprot:scaffold111781_cov17-Prasinocladus_malaysianus.AAC.1
MMAISNSEVLEYLLGVQHTTKRNTDSCLPEASKLARMWQIASQSFARGRWGWPTSCFLVARGGCPHLMTFTKLRAVVTAWEHRATLLQASRSAKWRSAVRLTGRSYRTKPARWRSYEYLYDGHKIITVFITITRTGTTGHVVRLALLTFHTTSTSTRT